MARGAQAKQLVVNKLQQAFGNDFIGEIDKKIYVWSQENGERVQIAISLTCPKVAVESAAVPVSGDGDWNFEDDAASAAAISRAPAAQTEITVEERARVQDLMAKLGL